MVKNTMGIIYLYNYVIDMHYADRYYFFINSNLTCILLFFIPIIGIKEQFNIIIYDIREIFKKNNTNLYEYILSAIQTIQLSLNSIPLNFFLTVVFLSDFRSGIRIIHNRNIRTRHFMQILYHLLCRTLPNYFYSKLL